MSPDNHKNTLQPRPALRWGRILLISLLSLLILLTGGVTWLLNDTERLKTVVEQLVSNLTDRQFLIKGEFDFRLGSEIRIKASQIEWANAAWSSQPTMLTVESADVSIMLGSLLNPPVVLSNAIVNGARLDFEWSPDNKSNWLLIKKDKPDKDRDKPLNPLPLLLETADLSNVELHFRHPKLTDELVIKIDQANSQQDDKNRLVLKINALIDDRIINVDGRIGPFPNLIVAGAIDFKLRAKGPDATVDLEGDFGNLARLQNPNLEFQLAAPEIRRMLDMLSLPEATSGQLALQGSIQSGDDAIDGAIKGTIGEFDINATLHADSLKSLDGLSANIDSRGPSTATAGNAIGIRGLPAEPYELKVRLADMPAGLQIDQMYFATANATATASGFIHDFPKLNRIDLKLLADAPDISRFKGLLPGKNIPQIPLRLDASVSSDAQGGEDIVTADLNLGLSNMQIKGLLAQNPQFIGSGFAINARLPNLLQFGKLTGIPVQRAETLTAKGELKITDQGLRLSKANGTIGQNNFTFAGDINFIGTPFNTTLDVNAAGSNIADAITLVAVTDRIPTFPYQLSGQLAFANKQLDLRQVSGTLGPNSISTDGSVILTPGLPNIDLQISASGPDLRNLLKEQGISDIPVRPFRLKTRFRLGESGISASGLDFQLADDALRGSISSGWPDNPKDLQFNVTANSANLNAALPAIPGYLPAAVKFEAALEGDLNDGHINFDKLIMVLGEANIDMTGRLDLPPNLQATNVKLRASGPRLSDLGALPNTQLPDLPFAVSATMGGTLNSIRVKDFSATAGPSDLRGTFTLDYTDKPEIGMDIQSTRIDLPSLMAPSSTKSPPDGAVPPANPAENDKRVIPDFKLPLDTLNSLDAAGTINIDELISVRSYLKNLSIDAELKSGTLDVRHLKAETKKGAMNAKFSLTPNSNGAKIVATGTANNLVLVAGELDETLRKNHPGQDVDLHLTGEGENLRDIAGSLNGFIWLRGGERQVAAAQLGLLFGDFLTQVIETVNPFAQKDPYQTLECDRVFFEATDGILQTSPAILLRSDKINIRSVGALSLKTEKIDFSIETTPRKGIGLSASDLVNPFIKIGGTMASPGLIPNATGTLIEGGAAVATMGISIVAKSMYKRWLSPRNPCVSLTEDARAIRSKRDPDNVPID